MDHDVVVVGGGPAGLACALRLCEHGHQPVVLEATDRVGGRVRTDVVDGFRLDHGFTVLLTGSPEAKRLLDYASLKLGVFDGVLVRRRGRFVRPAGAAQPRYRSARTGGVGTVGDRLRLARLRDQLVGNPTGRVLATADRPTSGLLRDAGFSTSAIEGFFRPLVSGLFFDSELGVSSRVFAVLLRGLFRGEAALPATGMEAVPRQLVSSLPGEAVHTGAAVCAVEPGRVRLTAGGDRSARAVVVATDGPAAARLLPEVGPVRTRAGTTLYLAAERPPLDEPVLLVDGDDSGPAALVAVPTTVAPSYAPAGRALLAAVVAGDPPESDNHLRAAVTRQLRGWFGPAADRWRHLACRRIRHALPDQTAPVRLTRPVRLRSGLYVCGDHRDGASIPGALASGRRAADAVHADLTDDDRRSTSR